MNNESFYMHPRYDEFTAFLKTLETDAKITPNALNLAFDVWLEIGFVKNNISTDMLAELIAKHNQYKDENIELLNKNTMLKAENDALKAMNAALTESNYILKQALNEVSE